MTLVKIYELKNGKNIISKKMLARSDDKIATFWVAILKNIVRIWKMIIRQTSRLSIIITKKIHVWWTLSRDKIDYFFEKIHRNSKSL
jgi:hypothetical protein